MTNPMPPQPDADAATNPAVMEHLTEDERKLLDECIGGGRFGCFETTAREIFARLAALRARVAELEEALREAIEQWVDPPERLYWPENKASSERIRAALVAQPPSGGKG